ncbi:hypothetical protein [Sunxiuqinia sp. sy24]|uniref:hypothetical protein n=1 Tax=Sunxiuqinia sp. sy24 TaxID=3461495 RepID=UPI0040452BFB
MASEKAKDEKNQLIGGFRTADKTNLSFGFDPKERESAADDALPLNADRTFGRCQIVGYLYCYALFSSYSYETTKGLM